MRSILTINIEKVEDSVIIHRALVFIYNDGRFRIVGPDAKPILEGELRNVFAGILTGIGLED